MKKILLIITISIFLSSATWAQIFKFAAMSDSRGSFNGVNKPVLEKLVNHLVENQKGVKFLIFPGDMVDGNKEDGERLRFELRNWKEIMKPAFENPEYVGKRVYVTVGNHEIQHRDNERIFREEFPDQIMNGPEDEKGLTYSFNYENTHFLVVNTDRWYYGDPDDPNDDRRDWHYVKHIDWIDKDLEKARKDGKEWIIVAGHEMIFPTGGHLHDGLPNLGWKITLPLDSTRLWYLNQRDKFFQVLLKHKAAAYICGHEHLYSRLSKDGVFQVLVGSSGAPVYRHNSKYGDNPEKRHIGQEMTYNQALLHYKILGYDYSPEGNAQVSKDFFGLRAFHYSVFEVFKDKIIVKTYGMPVKENTYLEIEDEEIKLLDEFEIMKPE